MNEWRESARVYEETFVLAEEISLDLVKDACKLIIGIGQYRELPGGVSAPEEDSLGKILFANVVHSNGHEVVVLNAYLKISYKRYEKFSSNL